MYNQAGRRLKKTQDLRGLGLMKQEDASELTFTSQSHSHHSTSTQSRPSDFPLAPNPDQFCSYHRKRLINIRDASSQLCCHVRECRAVLYHLQGMIVSWTKGSCSRKRKPLRVLQAAAAKVCQQRLPRSAALALLVVYEFHYTHTQTRNFCFHKPSRLSLNHCLFRYGWCRPFSCFSFRSCRLLPCSVGCHELTQHKLHSP